MAHFAQIDENGIVLNVEPISDSKLLDEKGVASEEVGISFCKRLYGKETNWKQCSYNNSFRGKFPGKGYRYDEVKDEFINPSEE